MKISQEQQTQLIRAFFLICAMILLVVPEPSGATKWISGFIFGAFLM